MPWKTFLHFKLIHIYKTRIGASDAVHMALYKLIIIDIIIYAWESIAASQFN